MTKAQRVRIVVETEIEPNVDQSVFEIAAAVVLEALHACSIFPDLFEVTAAHNGGSPSSPSE